MWLQVRKSHNWTADHIVCCEMHTDTWNQRNGSTDKCRHNVCAPRLLNDVTTADSAHLAGP